MRADVDVVVVGAGIVGLATADALLGTRPGTTIAVVDKEPTLAAHQSSHNSGVLHSGIYYRPGSLKARTAAIGRQAMVEFCAAHDIPHEVCGKLIVATTDEEIAPLEALRARGEANGVSPELLGPAGIKDHEPNATGVAALHVPEAGIADFASVCRALAERIRDGGATIALDTELIAIDHRPDGVTAATTRDDIRARVLVNCAGLQSDRVARLHGEDDGTRIVPFRGEYFDLRPDRAHVVRNLIYPVPDPRFPFLGAHFTRTIHGGVHAGPNAVPALAREGYRWRAVNGRDAAEILTSRSTWKLARQYWRTGAGEIYRSMRTTALVEQLQKLVPDVEAADLQPAEAGVRAQAVSPAGRLLDDFAVRQAAHVIDVINAPSPAATASLEIGRIIAGWVTDRL